MPRPLAKSTFVLLALVLWILACPASWAEDGEIEKGKYHEAITIAEKAVEMPKRAWGPEDPETADALNDLPVLCQKIGDNAKAVPLYEEALRIRRKVLGSEHPDTALSLNNLAGLYQSMGEYTKAEPLHQEALRIRQKVLGQEHPLTALSLDNLGSLSESLIKTLRTWLEGQAQPTKRLTLRLAGLLRRAGYI